MLPRRSARILRLTAVTASMIASLAAGCGDGGSDLGSERAEQVRSAAIDAGLPDEVADVLALAARGSRATYRVTYAGTGGGSVVVSQEPPNQRLDVVAGDVVVESRVVRGGITYSCSADDTPEAGEELDCERTSAAIDAPGVFTTEALDEFSDSLVGSTDRFDLTVEERTLAGVEATCLVASPKAGTPIDGTGPGVDTLCLSPEGAQLLIDSGGERLVADSYTTEVPEGTFEV